MLLSRLLDVEIEVGGLFALPFIMMGIGILIFVAVVVIIIVSVVKRVKGHITDSEDIAGPPSDSKIATIFKKTFENAEAKLDSETAKYKKVTCPYCGAVNKGSDTKCSGCSAPLNDK